jgi:hypothetical protein
MPGKERKTSITRITIESNFPPTKPERIPISVPKTLVTVSTIMTTKSDSRAPETILGPILLPKSSDPKRLSLLGGIRIFSKSIVFKTD